ncbi:MAG: ATP-binding cassette domain-containing protein, partial [Eubacteriales bacterium]|nr:ATP-binding cassette domain-containing protein [Eubacteriales bacterium]
AESREKMLAKIEVLEKPAAVRDEMHISLEPNIVSGSDVLTIRGLAKSFGSQTLFSQVDIDIKRGERVAVIGNNGTGKTTLLKLINAMLPADCGTITLGSNVHIGYYDQEHHVLHMEKTVFEEVQDAYPNLTNTQVRNILAAFLFTGDDVFKRISDLSGGERGRVSLAKLMLSEANFLILDEPTNHLDITSKEILEDALKNYTGTVLYVSHDRYFINQTATRILELSGGAFLNYIGNYDYYLEKKDLMNQLHAAPSGSAPAAAAPEPVSENKLDWKAQKEEQAKIRKRQNDLKRTEEEILQLETRNSQIDELLGQADVYTDVARLMELNKEKESIQTSLEELYERWDELASG